MSVRTLHLLILASCLSGMSLSQESPLAPPNVWPPVKVGMDKTEALKKIKSSGCDVAELKIQGSTDIAGILVPKDRNSGDIGGVVYFGANTVVGIARDQNGSVAPEVYENGMVLYRLLSNVTRGEQRLATVRTTSLDASNGTTRYIKLAFGNGKQVSIELSDPDPSSKRPQSVVMSECEGKCADW